MSRSGLVLLSDIDMDLPVEVKQPAAVKQLIWFVQGIILARGWIQEEGWAGSKAAVSPVTSKPASQGRIKTDHSGVLSSCQVC